MTTKSKLDELKEGVKTTQVKTKTTATKQVVKERQSKSELFIPEVDDDYEEVNGTVDLEEEEATALNIGAGLTPITNPGNRVRADLSKLPKPKDPNIKDKTPVDEVLGEGGVFEEYIKRKKREMTEDLKDKTFIDDEIEQTGDNEYVEAGEEEENSLDSEERELEEMYNNQNNEYEEEYEEVGTGYEEEEEVVEEVEEENHETAYPRSDDYTYKDEYTLPTDDELFPDQENTGVEEEETFDQPQEVESEKVDYTEESDSTKIIKSRKMAVSLVDEDSNEIAELELEDDEVDNAEEKRQAEEFQAEITEKIKPVATKLNLSGFTVVKKATMSDKVLNNVVRSAAKWVLPCSGIIFEMKEMSGADLEYIRENYQSGEATATRNVLRKLYDHIISPKPTTFEAWLKSTAYSDYDHLFMGAYIAAFNEANYVPYTCEKITNRRVRNNGCGNMYLSDNIPVMEMVKFADTEGKYNFRKLYDSNRVNSNGLYITENLPISSILAVSFKTPTLHSVFFETSSFSEEFRSKYARTIRFIPYIDNLYQIDRANSRLIPIDYQKFANNAGKTAKSKVIRYSKYIESLTTDEFSNLMALASAIDSKFEWFSYQIPESSCPKCGKKIEAIPTTAANLVFTRHRLAVLANSQIK